MPNELVARNGLIALNNSFVTGSLNVSNGITGSLFGTATTASYIQNAASASYALTASYALNASTATSASFATNAANATSASFATNAANATSASIAANAVTASRALNANTASFATQAANASSASFATNAANATSASYAIQASTASSADAFNVRGTLTATTLVVQTITSSVNFITGSTRFGNDPTNNTHQFSGSVSITGSLSLNSGVGTINATASWAARAVTASIADNAVTASRALNANTSSFATSAANATTASFATSAANATSASIAANAVTASRALQANTASYATFAATATSATSAGSATSASYATFAATASSANGFFIRGNLDFDTTRTISSNAVGTFLLTNPADAGIIELNAGSTSAYKTKINVYGRGNGNGITFTTQDTEKMRIADGGNVGIGTTSPKTKLDVDGCFGVGSKGVTITDSYSTQLTINLSNHTGVYVKVTIHGDLSSHSAIGYMGEFFIQNGAGAYAEPGTIIREVNNTATATFSAKLIDPASSGTRDFTIQFKHDASATSVACVLVYQIQGNYNSIS